MFVIRPIESKDLNAYQNLAFQASIGITTLPKNKALLEKKMHFSIESFHKKALLPQDELYLFVLENLDDHTIGGTCGIYSKSGISSAPCFYKIVQEKKTSPLQTPESRVLHPVKHPSGPSEICGIFLKKEFRHSGLGKLLSLSRFLFIATFPHFFTNTLISSIRGMIDANEQSPFWNSLGKHFIPYPLKEVFQLLEEHTLSFQDLIAPYPVPVALLTQRAQDVIGKPHQNSKPALKLLKKEGFEITDEIDIIDGGPKIMVLQEKIQTISKSKVTKVGELNSKQPFESNYLICNQKPNFRVCLGDLTILKNGTVSLSSTICKALQIDQGDSIRFLQLAKAGKQHG